MDIIEELKNRILELEKECIDLKSENYELRKEIEHYNYLKDDEQVG